MSSSYITALANFLYRLILGALITIMLAGCAVHIAPDYSPETANAIINTAKQVDQFYAGLLATPPDKRQYQNFEEKYQDIEVSIKSLILRSKIQPLNSDTTKMAETLLDLWEKTEAKHKKSNGYSDILAKIDEERYDSYFASMAYIQNIEKKSTNQ